MATKVPRHQAIPAGGAQREALRKKGQFWTPDWLAEAMVAYATAGGAASVYDPAVGAGAFFRAARKVAKEIGRELHLAGAELHRGVLSDAIEAGLTARDLKDVDERDFVLCPPPTQLESIVANPPYLRHHRLPPETKLQLRGFGHHVLGSALDGRAGYHVYFLLRALTLLQPGGRLAFVMPADTCEGVFAQTLWRWITKNFRLDAVITFAPEATPFPGVDTNAIVFLIQRKPPVQSFRWVSCTARGGELKHWLASDLRATPGPILSVVEAALARGVSQGLSRCPIEDEEEGITLGDLAFVMRGIATGANEFFHLTRADVQRLGIPPRFVISAVGRTRDVSGDTITREMVEELDARGRPTQLLTLDNAPIEKLPKTLQAYLKSGETMGLPFRPLIASRRPWYKMEVRRIPPFLFAYLGRRNARFIRNEAGVVPLTGFLCVYPRSSDRDAIESLWAALSHPDTVAGLSRVGKSYGGGAVKVEPRALERLPIPRHVLELAGIERMEEQLACL